ncbi:hypothetical protein C1H46_011470 [Malus baccata]|uniref:Uncharacterized protein n=1 Tax=Malus baccata TaxID=106549 RepID=A0A540MVV6_MALBA|nr:hypothetical protein C1H46_011470 [Malus baccata]
MPLHPSLFIVVISLRGQAAHFSPDRLPEGPDSRLGPDPQLLRQAFEGQGSSVQAGDHHGKKCAVFEAGIFPLGQRRGWTGRIAVGGSKNMNNKQIMQMSIYFNKENLRHPIQHLTDNPEVYRLMIFNVGFTLS